MKSSEPQLSVDSSAPKRPPATTKAWKKMGREDGREEESDKALGLRFNIYTHASCHFIWLLSFLSTEFKHSKKRERASALRKQHFLFQTTGTKQLGAWGEEIIKEKKSKNRYCNCIAGVAGVGGRGPGGGAEGGCGGGGGGH